MKRSMAEKTRKPRVLWTKDDIRMLKALAREKAKTTVIARKLKRTLRATQQKASMLGVRLGTSQLMRKVKSRIQIRQGDYPADSRVSLSRCAPQDAQLGVNHRRLIGYQRTCRGRSSARRDNSISVQCLLIGT